MSTFKIRISIEHLWGVVVLAGIFIFINTHPIRPYDFWWHITVGREILTSGKIPSIDVYSYTAFNQPYPSYNMFWLMEISLYWLYHLGGPALVIFIHSLVISLAYTILFFLAKSLSNSWRIAAFAVLFAAALGINDWNVRPQGVTFLLGSLFFLALHQYRHNRNWKWLAILPLGMVVWVNSHGTFVIGLALVGIWFLEAVVAAIWEWKNRQPEGIFNTLLIPSVVSVAVILACLFNPRGLGIVEYVKTLTSNSVVQNLVTEWAPPAFGSLMGNLFFAGLAISLLIMLLTPARPRLVDGITFLIFGLLALRTSRGIIWFGIVMVPILAQGLSAIMVKYSHPAATHREGSRVVNYLVVLTIAGMAIMSLPWFKSILPLPKAKAGLFSVETPIQATQILLEGRPPRQVFNAISFGSYMIWAAYPQYQVFVDSRIELFSEQTWMDYLNISNAVGDWESSLSAYGVNTLMLSPVEQPLLLKAALDSPQWGLIYQDETAAILVRK